MWRMRRRFSFWLVLVLLAGSAAQAVDRFYENLLRDGILADERGDAARAEKLLRLACFGLLEEPPVLVRCRLRLALVQAKLQDEAAFGATFERILILEQRFAAYSQADLSATERRLFESRVQELVDGALLERTPTFRHLARQGEEQPAGEATAESAAPPEARAAVEESVAPPEARAAVEESVAPPEARAAADEGPPPSAEAPPEPAADSPEELTAAIARAHAVRTTGTREETLRELELLRPLAEEHPEIRELQHLAAELAYRLRLWPESRTYFERGGDVDPDQPAVLFYLAVVLYETGDPEQAAEMLERSLPRLRRTAFVDAYVEKILGSADAP